MWFRDTSKFFLYQISVDTVRSYELFSDPAACATTSIYLHHQCNLSSKFFPSRIGTDRAPWQDSQNKTCPSSRWYRIYFWRKNMPSWIYFSKAFNSLGIDGFAFTDAWRNGKGFTDAIARGNPSGLNYSVLESMVKNRLPLGISAIMSGDGSQLLSVDSNSGRIIYRDFWQTEFRTKGQEFTD